MLQRLAELKKLKQEQEALLKNKNSSAPMTPSSTSTPAPTNNKLSSHPLASSSFPPASSTSSTSLLLLHEYRLHQEAKWKQQQKMKKKKKSANETIQHQIEQLHCDIFKNVKSCKYPHHVQLDDLRVEFPNVKNLLFFHVHTTYSIHPILIRKDLLLSVQTYSFIFSFQIPQEYPSQPPIIKLSTLLLNTLPLPKEQQNQQQQALIQELEKRIQATFYKKSKKMSKDDNQQQLQEDGNVRFVRQVIATNTSTVAVASAAATVTGEDWNGKDKRDETAQRSKVEETEPPSTIAEGLLHQQLQQKKQLEVCNIPQHQQQHHQSLITATTSKSMIVTMINSSGGSDSSSSSSDDEEREEEFLKDCLNQLTRIIFSLFEEEKLAEEQKLFFDQLHIEDADVEEGKIIGKNATGVVRMAKYKGQSVAVKTFLYRQDGSDLYQLIEDVRLLTSINHPKIISYHGYYIVKKKNYLKFIMELAPQGTLNDLLYGATTTATTTATPSSPTSYSSSFLSTSPGRKRYLKLQQPKNSNSHLLHDYKYLISVALDVAEGIQHLHRHNIIHRNIQPAYVLLLTDLSAKVHVDIQHLYRLKQNEKSAPAGSSTSKMMMVPHYASPEELDNLEHGFQVDSFAFGVLLNEMFKRKKPWNNSLTTTIASQVLNFKRDELASNAPIAVKQLIQSCWDQNPTHRPNFEQIVQTLSALKVSMSINNDNDNNS